MIGHRQHPENGVVAGQTQPGIGGLGAFQHVTMCQHHALGLAGRSRSEPHERGVLDSRRERRLRGIQPRETQTVAARIFQRDGPAGLGRTAAVVQNYTQGRARQHVRQFGRLHLVMDGHDHRAASQRRQRADDKSASVARPHAHALSFAHAQPVKLDPQRFDFAPERPVIQRTAGINDGHAVRPLPGGVRKGFKNVHGHLVNLNRNLAPNTSATPLTE